MIHVGFDNEDIVNLTQTSASDFAPFRNVELTFVLAPFAITRRLVMDPGQELELVQWHLLRLDT